MKSIILLAACLFAATFFGQAQDKNKEVEQIIITKKGAGNEKLNIVVDGDQVTVNGTPVDKDNSGNLTVTRRKIKDLDVFSDGLAAPGERRVIRRQLGAPQFPSRELGIAQYPNKAMLGVVTQKAGQGAEIINVTDESAAAKAGLKQGDIIIEVDRNKIATPDDLSKTIKDKNPGDKVTVVYLREKKQYTTVAELTKWNAPEVLAYGNGNMPEMPNIDIEQFMQGIPRNFENGNNSWQRYRLGFARSGPKLGIKIQDVENGNGVKVISVEKGSDADKAGLKEGDIIKEVNGTSVSGTDMMTNLVTANKAKSSLKLKVDRNGKSQNIDVNFTKKIKTADL